MLSFAIVWKRPYGINIINVQRSSKVNRKISHAVDIENLLVPRNNSYVIKGNHIEQDGKIVEMKDVQPVKNQGKRCFD